MTGIWIFHQDEEEAKEVQRQQQKQKQTSTQRKTRTPADLLTNDGYKKSDPNRRYGKHNSDNGFLDKFVDASAGIVIWIVIALVGIKVSVLGFIGLKLLIEIFT